jgi:hypothetical protein
MLSKQNEVKDTRHDIWKGQFICAPGGDRPSAEQTTIFRTQKAKNTFADGA